jgi:gliding motility-associated-like protein
MRKHLCLVTFLLLLPVIKLSAQLDDVIVESYFGNQKLLITGDTLKISKDSIILFKARAFDQSGARLKNVTYKWYFGDGSNNLYNQDSVFHVYSQGRGYYLRLNVTDSLGNINKKVIPIQVALEPDWKNTNSNVGESTICKGDQIELHGDAKKSDWTYNPVLSVTHELPKDLFFKYESKVTLESFDAYQELTTKELAYYDSVCLSLQHSKMPEIRISLICPDGKSTILKDYGGESAVMGYEKDDENAYGIPLTYCWKKEDAAFSKITETPAEEMSTYTFLTFETNSFQLDTVIEGQPATIDTFEIDTITNIGHRLPEGTYKPFESFNNLLGCPMNGYWTILVRDSSEFEDFGYVSGWELNINDTLFQPYWEFENTYDPQYYQWEGDSIIEDNGADVVAVPKEYGEREYTLTAYDDWGDVLGRDKGYPHETTVIVEVTEPGIEISGSEFADSVAPFNGRDTVQLEFNDTAEWAVNSRWIYEEEQLLDSNNTISLSIYERNGYGREDQRRKYEMTMIAVSEQGCTDTIRTVFYLEVPEIEFSASNIFTPNGDRINDIFQFKWDPYHFKEIEIKIYNRWGKLMKKWMSWEEFINDVNEYTSSGSNNFDNEEKPLTPTDTISSTTETFGWDGKIKNSDRIAPPGLYFYHIIAKSLYGEKIKKEQRGGYFYLYRNGRLSE